MREDVLNYVRELSLLDQKTLGQKVLKLMEETGELAKAALPFENAFCTTHRFVTPEKILEEVADTILVALSIAYTLGYTHEDVTQDMVRKADYWAELQSRESRVTDKTPYEIHVTVAAAQDVGSFRQACRALGVKPIILDLQQHNAGVIKDVMTSSVFFGRNSEAYAELQRIAEGLAAAGFTVVRRKIETVPWHPAAPSRRHANPVMPASCYFECHFSVRLTNSEQQYQLSTLAAECQCHLSRNVFKRHEDGSATVMLTYRSYVDLYETVQESVANIKSRLLDAGFALDKDLIEFSLFDSKVSHDAAWLTGRN